MQAPLSRSTRFIAVPIFSLTLLIAGAIAFWGPTLVTEPPLGMAPSTGASTFGLVTAVCGVVGTAAGGMLNDYCGGGTKRALRQVALSMTLSFPLGLLAFHTSSHGLFFTLLAMVQLLLFNTQVPCPIGGRIACCAHAVHKACTIPYPNCIVVPSLNNGGPREYRVWSPSAPPSPSQPGHSVSSHCQRLSGAIPRHRGSQIHRLRRCHNHTWQVGQHGPPPLQPPVVRCASLYRHSGRHIRGRHRGQDIHAHEADRLHTQHQSRGPKERALQRLLTLPSEREGASLSFD